MGAVTADKEAEAGPMLEEVTWHPDRDAAGHGETV